jgi:hypothetical protein
MQNIPEIPAGPGQPDLAQETMKAETQLKGAAGWFFWVAGLSLINSLVHLFGGNLNFAIGLGITQLIDGMAAELATDFGSMIQPAAFVINAGIAGLFVLFGVLGGKKQTWAFVVGMLLYALDGLLFLLVSDYLSVGFHLFVLFWLFGGPRAIKKLDEIEKSKRLAF